MEPCEHEAEPYPAEMIVVSDEEFYANPLRQDWAPPRFVPCLKCGAPLDRGRYSGMVSIPALRRWP